jgi:hypothetical protein
MMKVFDDSGHRGSAPGSWDLDTHLAFVPELEEWTTRRCRGYCQCVPDPKTLWIWAPDHEIIRAPKSLVTNICGLCFCT